MKRIATAILLVGCTDLPDYDDPRQAEVDQPSCDNLLANGDFDAGPVSWIAKPADVIRDDRDLPSELQSHSGNYFAWLGGAPSATRSVAQQVSVPDSVDTLTLDAKMFVATESESGRVEDTLQVQLLDSAGGVIATPTMLSNVNETDRDSSFVRWTDLRLTFAKPVRLASLRLLSTNDANLNTNFFFDTLTLLPAGCP